MTKSYEMTPRGYKVNPQFIENKTKRVHVLIQPSIHAIIKNKAIASGVSVNEIINRAIKEFLKR